MSLKIEGCSCVRCKAYLFSEDDVVYCPVCGAPHHRDCYEALGHCALEQLHGTDEQYSREKEQENRERIAQREQNAEREKQHEESAGSREGITKCSMCGNEYESMLRRCPRCGTPDLSNINGYSGFDFLGGVAPDRIIEDDITAEDVKRFVFTNTHRYVPKFASINKDKKASWNWMAFLFPCGWMLSRKMYKGGIIAGILQSVITLLSYPFQRAIMGSGYFDAENAASTIDALNNIFENTPKIGLAILALAALGAVLELVLRVIFALYGDYFYRDYTLSAIKKIRLESEDMEEDYRKKGGMSMLLFFLGLMITQYIPAILVSLL